MPLRWISCAQVDYVFYILSPLEIIVARPCDTDDRIEWMMSKRRYGSAYNGTLGPYKVLDA